ncbi:hypothetical protein ONA91_26970 [Micromonospora sp. DR5-3]|uniref:hypothetical protein n=1 Tax=unclassified Micromonospora TaxID=2617518 RepID=UPI0011D91786|nr:MULTISPECIES: hypothetical protein [unclassified Micromonospora]MCW3818096.1 hypothetical protein [Micromonospora sp. DR5-3]TYC22298.1 hypothetical protein FXF52_21430 [Micromonospora sp. MP36]
MGGNGTFEVRWWWRARAADAARAAMLAVAALVHGADGPEWLAGQGVPAWPRARPAALPQPAARW